MYAFALPPVNRPVAVRSIIVSADLIEGGASLTGRVFALLVHKSCQPKDGSDTFLHKALYHRCRVGITLGVPLEIVICGTPRAVNDDCIHGYSAFEIFVYDALGTLRGVNTVLPHDMSECPSRGNGRAHGARIDAHGLRHAHTCPQEQG